MWPFKAKQQPTPQPTPQPPPRPRTVVYVLTPEEMKEVAKLYDVFKEQDSYKSFVAYCNKIAEYYPPWATTARLDLDIDLDVYPFIIYKS